LIDEPQDEIPKESTDVPEEDLTPDQKWNSRWGVRKFGKTLKYSTITYMVISAVDKWVDSTSDDDDDRHHRTVSECDPNTDASCTPCDPDTDDTCVKTLERGSKHSHNKEKYINGNYAAFGFFFWNWMFYLSITKLGTSGCFYKYVLKFSKWWGLSITFEYIFDIIYSRRKWPAIFGAILWPFAYKKFSCMKWKMFKYIRGDLEYDSDYEESDDDTAVEESETVFEESITDELAALI